MPMSKLLSIRIYDKLYTKLDNQEMKNEDIVTEAIHQFFENKEQNEEQNNEIVTILKENVKTLEKQKKSLEIENVCFKQENKDLKTRIDDVAQLFPSAVALLGKTSESRKIKKNKWIFKK